MLNELNKNHMGGIDNYGAEDLYNMEDVWNERGYDPKLSKKVNTVFYNQTILSVDSFLMNYFDVRKIVH